MDSNFSEGLRSFKSHIRNFFLLSQPRVVNDSCKDLFDICVCIETLLAGRVGDERSATLFLDHARNRLYGKYSKFSPELSTLRLQFDSAHNQKKVKTNVGRFRLYIRFLLSNSRLGETANKLKLSEGFEPSLLPMNSILRDSIAFEIFCAAALSLESAVKFELQVSNASLLDFSWELAETKYIEAVPSDRYGFGVERVDDFLLVGRVYKDSVLIGQIDVGDIIDELYEFPARDIADSLVDKYFSRAKREPLRMKMLKYRRKDRTQCRAIDYFVQKSNYAKESLSSGTYLSGEPVKDEGNIPAEALLSHWCADVSPAYVSGENSSYKARYLFSKNLGKNHTTAHLTNALREDLINVTGTPCFIQLNETHIKVLPSSHNSELPSQLLEEKGFIDIPCCGRGSYQEDDPASSIFGYICRSSNYPDDQFMCHIFHSDSTTDVVRILYTLAQGFERTAFSI